MRVTLVREQNPVWSEEKKNLLSQYPRRFNIECGDDEFGQPLPNIWFEVRKDGSCVGFAWLTFVEQENIAEIQICLSDPGHGVGTEVLKELENQVRLLGAESIIAVVQAGNDARDRLVDWLQNHGFTLELPPGWTVSSTFRVGHSLTLRKNVLRRKPASKSMETASES